MTLGFQESVLLLNHIQPEEDVTGYVANQSANRAGAIYSLNSHEFQLHGDRLAWVYPTNLERLSSAFDGVLPDVDTLIAKHTRYPLYGPFQSLQGRRRLYGHHAGNAQQGVAAIVGAGPVGMRGRLAICPQCVHEDVRAYGYATWQRLHLMPGIFTCAEHEHPLLTFCDACDAGHRRHRSTWRPTVRCTCGDSLRLVANLDSKEEEVANRVSRMAYQLLQGKVGCHLDELSVPKALRNLLHGCGSGVRRAGALAELFMSEIGKEGMVRLGLGKTTLLRLTNPEHPPVRNAVVNMTTIGIAFGSWEKMAAFAERVATPWKATDATYDKTGGSSRRRRGNRFLSAEEYAKRFERQATDKAASVISQYREWLLRHLARNPTLLRSEVERLPKGKSAVRHFRAVDSEWYDQVMPAKLGQGINNELSKARMRTKVEQLRQRILERREESHRVTPFRRVTRAYLLNNSATEAGSTMVNRSTEIVATLKSCVDSNESWKQRVVQLLSTHVRKLCAKSDFGDPTTYDGLKHRSLRVRVARARKWIEAFKA